MKKILLLLVAFFCNCIQVFSYDLKTFDIRETYFNKDYKTVATVSGKVANELTSFKFKGAWADPLHLANRVMLEELSCNISSLICFSNVFSIDFMGCDVGLNPYLDFYSLSYQIIDIQRNKYKLYCAETEYIIEVDVLKNKATKYKVFSNGDVNKYDLLTDEEEIKKDIAKMIK